MTKPQFEIELDTALAREPFVPFVIILAGGMRYRVEHPDLVVVMQSIIYHYASAGDGCNV